MRDLIDRQAAIDAANDWLLDCLKVQKQGRSCGLIRRLEDLPSAQPEQKELSDWKKEFRAYVDALNMPRDDYNGIMEYIEEVPSAQPEPCEDAVSRKDVVKFLDDWMSALEANCHHQSMADLKIIKNDFENLPSAQPEQRWIPVTKDTLPEEGKVVIVKGLKGTWDFGTYRGFGHINGEEDIHRWQWKKNTYKSVYWWMYKDGALPEPHKMESEEV